MLTRTISNTSTWAAALLLLAGGCEGAEPVDADGDGEIRLRGDDYPLGKLNTNFLGVDETYPLDSIPLFYDANANVRLHAVWATTCVDRTIGTTYTNELFYTSDLDGVLGISVSDGDLESATFKKYGEPSVTCTVSGGLWKNTVWGVITVDENDVEHNNYLMILDRRLDTHGHWVYKWGVLTGLNPFSPDSYTPTCSEATDTFLDLAAYRYHAYLVDDLAVDHNTGDFSAAADQMFIACISGAVGKSAFWGYVPWEVGTDYHELATRMVRADYCGDGNSYTEVGTPIQVRDKLGINSIQDNGFPYEAAWDLASQSATCLTTPRNVEVDAADVPCGLPQCTYGNTFGKTLITRL
ncbi:MAG: hypothetical protein KC420_00140, partial [Myxococcales bacterium]|nr:hypothetical protein [Myxococcales bacterium]